MSESETQALARPSAISNKPMAICPTDFETAHRVALAIVKSGIAPKAMQTPEAVFVAMQLGAGVGLNPMQSVQNIAVINGKPGLYGDAQLAIVKASGELEYIKESFEGGGEDRKAVCIVKRAGEDEVRSEFSIADAKRAKLWGKSGPWTEYPQRMMKYRARSFALRDTFPDRLLGLCHSVEELMDTPPRDVTPKVTSMGDFGKAEPEHPDDHGTSAGAEHLPPEPRDDEADDYPDYTLDLITDMLDAGIARDRPHAIQKITDHLCCPLEEMNSDDIAGARKHFLEAEE